MRMFRMVAVAALAVGLGGVALAQGDVIAERRALMKRSDETMKALKAVADANAAPTAETVAMISAKIADYQRLPSLFPAGSDHGDTKAKPELWTDNATFQQANQAALTALGNLRTAAASGSATAYAEAFRAVGPTCGGCHRPFRNR